MKAKTFVLVQRSCAAKMIGMIFTKTCFLFPVVIKISKYRTRNKRTKVAHCRILSKIPTYFSMSQKSKPMLEFQAHICWVITVDYKVRLGQVKSEFNQKRQKLTRSVRASKLSIFSTKYNCVCRVI